MRTIESLKIGISVRVSYLAELVAWGGVGYLVSTLPGGVMFAIFACVLAIAVLEYVRGFFKGVMR